MHISRYLTNIMPLSHQYHAGSVGTAHARTFSLFQFAFLQKAFQIFARLGRLRLRQRHASARGRGEQPPTGRGTGGGRPDWRGGGGDKH